MIFKGLVVAGAGRFSKMVLRVPVRVFRRVLGLPPCLFLLFAKRTGRAATGLVRGGSGWWRGDREQQKRKRDVYILSVIRLRRPGRHDKAPATGGLNDRHEFPAALRLEVEDGCRQAWFPLSLCPLLPVSPRALPSVPVRVLVCSL